jgi:hypothetical protein
MRTAKIYIADMIHRNKAGVFLPLMGDAGEGYFMFVKNSLPPTYILLQLRGYNGLFIYF